MINEAIQKLKNGGVIAYPTEAVYGLGCDPFNQTALKRLLKMKQRSRGEGLILLISDYDQFTHCSTLQDETIMAKIKASWPGPVTWIVPASQSINPLIRGKHESVALRMSAHPVAKALVEAYQQPLVSTSANISGSPPATSAEEVLTVFKNTVDLIVEGAIGTRKKPSEIRDAMTDTIIRQ